MNFIPGVAHGRAKENACRLASSPSKWVRVGYTAISSEIGPRVARMRLPRTTIPASVSLITVSATWSSILSNTVGLRLRCRFTNVWVRVTSLSRMYSWYRRTLSLNSGRLAAKYSEEPAHPDTAALRKSGVRAIMPQLSQAQLVIMIRRRSRSSADHDDRPTGSPEDGDSKVISSLVAGSCCMS